MEHPVTGFHVSSVHVIPVPIQSSSQSRLAVLRLASQVRALLEGGGAGFTALLAGQFDAYEPETKVFRQSLDFSCWEHQIGRAHV